MHARKLARLRRELDALRTRTGSITREELESLAKRLGRKRVNRGKEPTYEWPGRSRNALSIPQPHGTTLKKGTACNILDQLEEDIDLLETEVAPDEE